MPLAPGKRSLLLSAERMSARWSSPSRLCDGEETEAGVRVKHSGSSGKEESNSSREDI